MKKIVLAVLAVIPFSVPVMAQSTMAQVAESNHQQAAVACERQSTSIEALLKSTGYSSEELSATLDQAWKLYRSGCSDINAVDNGGNTILHLIVRATPDQWPTKLEQWVKAGVKDVPNDFGKTALQELEEDMKRIAKDNELYRGLLERRVPAEYTKARKVLKNTPEEKERKELRKKAEKKEILESIIRSFETSK